MQKFIFLKSKVIVTLLALLVSCEKADLTDAKSRNLVRELEVNNPINYSFEELSKENQLKVTISESLENIFSKDETFAKDFINSYLLEGGKTKEFLYQKSKKSSLTSKSFQKNGKSLEDLLIENIKVPEHSKSGRPSEEVQKKVALIKNAETILPNLVIKIPEWVEYVIDEVGIENMNFAVYPAVGSQNVRNIEAKTAKKQWDESMFISEFIPIQVKESEFLIPVEKNSNLTIWSDDFISDHFPSLQGCNDFKRQNYIVYSDEKYDYIDRFKLNTDLMNGVICGIKIASTDKTSKSPCKKVYQRDCVKEKNVIEGIQFANLATFQGMNNQPGGEEVISLHYVFVVSQMCGDLSVSKDCPPTTWKFVFNGKLTDFFHIQVHRGYPTQNELSSVIYRNPYARFYVKAYPKYYDIPVSFSANGMYSQAGYLINTPSSTWDGNIYGSVVSFSVYEHDDIVVSQSQNISVTVNNVTKVSGKLNIKEIFSVGADFDENVSRTTSYTYTIDAAKDVELGQNASVYQDENHYRDGKLYGINKSTGSVITHFAFYY